MTNNSKRKAKIATLNVPIPIPIELLQFLSKKGQYIVPNNIVDQYAHVWLCEESDDGIQKENKEHCKDTNLL